MTDQNNKFDSYYSDYYKRLIPATRAGWRWVIDRIELNFGEYFDGIPRDKAILDIPCGVGYLEHYLLEKKFERICAVDVSKEQVEIAKAKLEEYGIDLNGKVTFFIENALEYLRKKHTYSAIAMIDFLEHLDNQGIAEVLNLAYVSLDEKGFLFVRVPNSENPFWRFFFYKDPTHATPLTSKDIHRYLKLANFEIIKIDYEISPKIIKKEIKSLTNLKKLMRKAIIFSLSKIFNIDPRAFSRDLVAVAVKR